MLGGGGDDQLWGSGRGALPLQGAMVGGRVTTNFGAVDVVPLLPLQSATVVCYIWGGRWLGKGDDQLCGSGRGAIGCHCRVLWLGGRVPTNFGE